MSVQQVQHRVTLFAAPLRLYLDSRVLAFAKRAAEDAALVDASSSSSSSSSSPSSSEGLSSASSSSSSSSSSALFFSKVVVLPLHVKIDYEADFLDIAALQVRALMMCFYHTLAL